MSENKTFKRIDARSDVSVALPANTIDQLDALARELTANLGFDVTIANAIAWLLADFKKRPATASIAPPKVQLPAKLIGVPGADELVRLSEDTIRIMNTRVRDMMSVGATNNKIEAIKEVRGCTGMSLRNAKDYVDGEYYNKP